MAEECPKCSCPAGIPAWVLTFADLMSLLMCFFVLLLSFAEMDVQKYKQIAGSMKMAFGVQRIIKAEEPPKGVNIIAKEFSPAPPQPTVINEVRQKTSEETNQELRLVKKLEELEVQETELSRKLGKAETQEEREEIQEKIKKTEEEIEQAKKDLEKVKESIETIQQKEIQEQAMQVAASLQKEIQQGLLDVETNRDSFLIRIRDKGAFPPGSATLSDDFIDVLEVIKEELEKVSGGIIVSGHTDDVPINTRTFRSNWDLSAERSVSVVQELLYESTIDPKRLSIQAYAESRPLAPNDSAENRSKNRRVEIVVSKSRFELDTLDANGNTNAQEEGQKEGSGPANDTPLDANADGQQNAAPAAEPDTAAAQNGQIAPAEQTGALDIARPQPDTAPITPGPAADQLAPVDAPPPNFISF